VGISTTWLQCRVWRTRQASGLGRSWIAASREGQAHCASSTMGDQLTPGGQAPGDWPPPRHGGGRHRESPAGGRAVRGERRGRGMTSPATDTTGRLADLPDQTGCGSQYPAGRSFDNDSSQQRWHFTVILEPVVEGLEYGSRRRQHHERASGPCVATSPSRLGPGIPHHFRREVIR